MPSPDNKVPPTSATKQDLEEGVLLFKRQSLPKGSSRVELIKTACELGCFEDIDERAWLCKQLDLEFMIDMSNLELVHLALDSGVDFNKRG